MCPMSTCSQNHWELVGLKHGPLSEMIFSSNMNSLKVSFSTFCHCFSFLAVEGVVGDKAGKVINCNQNVLTLNVHQIHS